MNGKSMKDTVKFANTMSVLTIAHEETIAPEMSEEAVLHHREQLVWVEKSY